MCSLTRTIRALFTATDRKPFIYHGNHTIYPVHVLTPSFTRHALPQTAPARHRPPCTIRPRAVIDEGQADLATIYYFTMIVSGFQKKPCGRPGRVCEPQKLYYRGITVKLYITAADFIFA